jgi:hypothetical protein
MRENLERNLVLVNQGFFFFFFFECVNPTSSVIKSHYNCEDHGFSRSYKQQQKASLFSGDKEELLLENYYKSPAWPTPKEVESQALGGALFFSSLFNSQFTSHFYHPRGLFLKFFFSFLFFFFFF